jgi:hypothetical protein
MKRFHIKVQRIQRGWLRCCREFALQAELVNSQWITLERHLIVKELGIHQAESSTGGQGRIRKPAIAHKKIIEDATGSSLNHLGLNDKIAVNMIPEKARMEFIRAELRYLRFMWLPDLIFWRANMEKYWREVVEWRTAKAAQKAMYASQNIPPPDRPAFPSMLPNEVGILDMILRCRKDRKSYRVVSLEQAILPGRRKETQEAIDRR